VAAIKAGFLSQARRPAVFECFERFFPKNEINRMIGPKDSKGGTIAISNIYGYVRTSTRGQNEARQRSSMNELSVQEENVIMDKLPAKRKSLLSVQSFSPGMKCTYSSIREIFPPVRLLTRVQRISLPKTARVLYPFRPSGLSDGTSFFHPGRILPPVSPPISRRAGQTAS
jgi:hypothetical protein